MKRIATVVSIACLASVVSGCSFLDFFGYKDNAPLHVVERPEGYPTILFGSEMAAMTYRLGEETSDLVAVSGGAKYPTAIYRLSHNGKLSNVDDFYDEYLMNEKDKADSSGSGASLAGLSTWTDEERYTGCFAVGEPEANQVRIICEQDKERFTIAASATGETVEEFGCQVAAVPPVAGDSWLLAAASEETVTVFSSSKYAAENRSNTVRPTWDGAPVSEPIVELAAGRLSDGRFFVAATTSDDDSELPDQIHLFIQAAPASMDLVESACLNRTGEDGFGGVMTTGDLDGDGNDELVVSAGYSEERVDAVYIWEISQLAAAAPTCNSDTPDPGATIYPEDGPLDVSCEEGEACDFGFALAVGDISTDDDGPELIVGAPGARVEGRSGAGAAYVYRGAEISLDGSDGTPVASRVAHSTPEKGYRFGGGLVVASAAGRNELLVGATGKGHMIITYCTGVGEDIEEGADVTTNASGSVVSTRCRPE